MLSWQHQDPWKWCLKFGHLDQNHLRVQVQNVDLLQQKLEGSFQVIVEVAQI